MTSKHRNSFEAAEPSCASGSFRDSVVRVVRYNIGIVALSAALGGEQWPTGRPKKSLKMN
jgi:hypothetical protein